MADPRVEVMFSGLVLFVRDAESRRRVTHVLLRDARHHDKEIHDPYLCFCDPKVRLTLDRQQLEFRWYDGSENELIVGRAGALPRGRVSDLDELPRGNEEFFYWTPYLGRGRNVPRCCLGTRCVPPTVVASVRLHDGPLYTADLAFVEQENAGKREEFTAVMSFRDEGGKAGGLREQACSEKILWEPDVPSNASRLEIWATAFWSEEPAPSPVLLRSFDLSHTNPLRITISNNSRPVWSLDRGPGSKAEHFKMFYDLVQPIPPSGERPMPHAPLEFRRRDVGGQRRNVMPYIERGVGFADCHKLDETCSSEPKRIMKRILRYLGVKHSTRERPICVPAVADEAPQEKIREAPIG